MALLVTMPLVVLSAEALARLEEASLEDEACTPLDNPSAVAPFFERVVFRLGGMVEVERMRVCHSRLISRLKLQRHDT